MNGFVCPEGKFTDIVIDGVKLRWDGGHFTEAGSVPVARWLLPQIAAAAGWTLRPSGD
jgi:lysophospholipase L1-like esterase